jgi:hypothetical protein
MKPCVRAIQASTGLVYSSSSGGSTVDPPFVSVTTHTVVSMTAHTIVSVTTHTIDVATVPPGGWLGSGADEGRAKLR